MTNPPDDLEKRFQNALWAGDVDALEELAPCGCCCHEHTFDDCPARAWHGCRGQGTMTRAEENAWADMYSDRMTREEFFYSSP